MKDKLKQFFRRIGLDIYHAPAYKMDTTKLAIFEYFARMYANIREKNGDIVECGVGRGKTFLYLNCLANQEDKVGLVKNRTCWGFDSFMGFPEPSRLDYTQRNPKKGDWSGITQNFIKKLLKNADINKHRLQEKTKLVPGYFEKTVAQYPSKEIALLHLDVDLYNSYKVCLEALFPKVIVGGVVLFDEYQEEIWPGATKAIDEYFQNRPEKIQKDFLTGKHYLIKQS